MRRLPLLLVAAVAAFAAVPSLAVADPSDDTSQAGDPCPVPDITGWYDAGHLRVHATLVASGCPTREHRQFAFSAFVTRHDGSTAEGHGENVACGPFPSASDGPGEPPKTYSCDIEVVVDHPSAEAAHYEVEFTYPGADGEETFAFDRYCKSDADGPSCDEGYQPDEPASSPAPQDDVR